MTMLLKKMFTNLFKHKIISMVLLILLTYFMLMVQARPYFQDDSESLVCDPILAIINGMSIDQRKYGLGVLQKKGDSEVSTYHTILTLDPDFLNEYNYMPYTSQVGVQGYFFSFFAHLIKSKTIIDICRCFCCLIFSVVVVFIVCQLYQKYGLVMAITFWITTVNSKWISDFSPNLYWVMFTWFIPMLIGLLCLRYEEKRKWFYPLFFFSVVIKCLCGFEYISTIMISAEAFLVTEWILNKEKRKSIFVSIIMSGLCMLAGFGMASFLMIIKYGNGRITDGVQSFMYNLVERRTYGDPEAYPEVYNESLNASIGTVIKKYFWDFPTGKIMISLLIISLILLIIEFFVFRRNIKMELSLLILFLVSTLSWLVLAKSHSYQHTHINFILFYMGFAQTAVFCIVNPIYTHINNKYVVSKAT